MRLNADPTTGSDVGSNVGIVGQADVVARQMQVMQCTQVIPKDTRNVRTNCIRPLAIFDFSLANSPNPWGTNYTASPGTTK